MKSLCNAATQGSRLAVGAAGSHTSLKAYGLWPRPASLWRASGIGTCSARPSPNRTSAPHVRPLPSPGLCCLIPKCTPACLYLRSLGCTPSRRRSVAAHRHLCRRSSGSMACLFDPICRSGERERLHQEEEGCRGRTSGRGLIIGGGEQRVKGRDAAARAWRGEGIARGKGWPNGPHGTGTSAMDHSTAEHGTTGHGGTAVPCRVVPLCRGRGPGTALPGLHRAVPCRWAR